MHKHDGRAVRGRCFRILTVVDDLTIECLGLVVDNALTGPRVVRGRDRITKHQQHQPSSIYIVALTRSRRPTFKPLEKLSCKRCGRSVEKFSSSQLFFHRGSNPGAELPSALASGSMHTMLRSGARHVDSLQECAEMRSSRTH